MLKNCSNDSTYNENIVVPQSTRAFLWKIEPSISIDHLLKYTEALKGAVMSKFGSTSQLDSSITGHVADGSFSTTHNHAHYFSLLDKVNKNNFAYVGLWVPDGIDDKQVELLYKIKYLFAKESNTTYFAQLTPLNIEQSKSIFESCLHASQFFTTTTPYLASSHRKKNQSIKEFLYQDLVKEFSYRNLPLEFLVFNYKLTKLSPIKRSRNSEPSLFAYQITLQFDKKTRGPLFLGRYAHFGYGLFVPLKEG